MSCMVQYLRDNNEQSWAWSLLGNSYQQQSRMDYANICFKQSANIAGSLISFVHGWYFLGPFVVGKSEVDGDPLEFFGGIHNVSRTRFARDIQYYSELAPNGVVRWISFPEYRGRYVTIDPVVNWKDLVNSLGSLGITEWQGWVVGDIAVNAKNVKVSLRCMGVHTVLVDGFPVVGDIYRREQFSFPVALSRGLHTIYIRGRTKGALEFRCDVDTIPSSSLSFQILKPPFIPDIYEGRFFSKYFPLLILNRNASDWLVIKRISIVNIAPPLEGVNIKIGLKGDKAFPVAPGQTRPIIIELIANDFAFTESCTKVKLTLLVSTSLGSAQSSLSFRCRGEQQSFLFTFIDHDGSLQHAAAIKPLLPCEEKLCPVVLTLHGTSVPPQNQVDSYKQMISHEFVFGLETAWILAPTRHVVYQLLHFLFN